MPAAIPTTIALLAALLLPHLAVVGTAAELKVSTAAVPHATTDGVTLEVDGENVSTTAHFTAPETGDDAPGVIPVAGDYHAAEGGTLRLRFGEPAAATAVPAGKLISFWKFDEAKGNSAADLKAPENPATIVGGDAEAERPTGVGFGNVHALRLDAKSRVDTQFTRPLDGTKSISMWSKTTGPGVLLDKVHSSDTGFADGSRLVQIGADGLLEARLTGATGSTLRSEKKLTDGEWHHFAWVTAPGLHQLYIDGKLEAQAKPEDGAPLGNDAVLRFGGSTGKPADGVAAPPTLEGMIDNVRIYDFAINARQIEGFHLVGSKRTPIVITSEPQKQIRVGQTFNYALEFTGAPYVQFRFIGLPDWLKFEGRITGSPGEGDIGRSERITITGICPWGPAQQEFTINVLPPIVPDEWQFSTNGKPLPFRRIANGIEIDLPKGKGRWSFAKKEQ